MSKCDHVITSFCCDHLEAMTKWVHGEDWQQDNSNNKFQPVQEEPNLLQNEKKINSVDETVRFLEDKLRLTEQQNERNDETIRLLKAHFKSMEDYANSADANDVGANQPAADSLASERAKMLQILHDTDHIISHLHYLVNSIRDQLPCAIPPNQPRNIICSILACRMNLLKKAEENVDSMMDKLQAVNQLLEQFLAMRQHNLASEPQTSNNSKGEGDCGEVA